MHSRNEYLKALRESYLKAKATKEKSQILDEDCRNTGQSRKYIIRKIHRMNLKPKLRKKRKETYNNRVKAALAKLWEIFHYPCGQRVKPLLEAEVERLRELDEIKIPDEIAVKLKSMSPAAIDRKLKHHRDYLHLSHSKSGPKPSYLLKENIPVRLTEWDTSKVGYVGMDFVVHCGSSTLCLPYANTLSVTEISSGWWEGEATMGRSQEYTFWALKEIRKRTPFNWKGIDSDNGPEFINHILY